VRLALILRYQEARLCAQSAAAVARFTKSGSITATVALLDLDAEIILYLLRVHMRLKRHSMDRPRSR
jgi:hypothetical protein